MSGSPTTGWTCERNHGRYTVPRDEEACIELEHPEGTPRRLTLLEIGDRGVSFDADDDMTPALVGLSLPVVIRTKTHEMRGTLVIRHVTSGLSTGNVCGAELHPATDADGSEVKSLIDESVFESRLRG